MSEFLTGHIERIVFQNPENNWTVARLSVEGRLDPITVVGALPVSQPGEVLELKGSWTDHPKFGRQFVVESSRMLIPSNVDGIERFLASGLIQGIGPVMARRLVNAFGADTLEVIENDIQRLRRVEGIGKKTIEKISESWGLRREMRDLTVFLQTHGVSVGLALKIFKRYGANGLEVVKQNPYTLVTDLFGVGFLTADKLAQEIGFEHDSVLRAEAGVLYVLQRMMDNGHVCLPDERLYEESVKLLDIPQPIVERAVRGLMDRDKVAREELDGRFYYYTRAMFLAERGVAKHLTDIVRTGLNLSITNWKADMEWVENQLTISLNEEQRRAIEGALTNNVFVVTGGPGTGKTTIVRGILEMMNRRGLMVALAAPTGRAAKRLSETTQREAKTIHRLLEFNPIAGVFKRDYDHPLDADAVIIDEASMVDTPLMYSLVKAVSPDASLVLVGDVNQLPSVGPGSVLRDIIESKSVHVAWLTEIFRQARESRIVINAHRINEGLFPFIEQPPNDNLMDFYFLEHEDPEKVLELIIKLCSKNIPERFGLNSLHDIQVITPMNRGTVGVTNLNKELQNALNPAGQGIDKGERTFRVNDKVMQLRNNYDKEVFNGDIGNVISIDQETRSLKVMFDIGVREYSLSDMDELALAYAISVHKSQGSEYPAVVMPLLTQHYMMLQRNLLYTAITRGKKLVIVIGAKKALSIAIRNDKPLERFSLLKQRLRSELGEAGDRERPVPTL